MNDPDRDRILQAIRENHEAFWAARERFDEATRKHREELWHLLEEGRAAGLGRKAMSKAAGMSLPSLSKLIDDGP